jgi:hypothetical protein
LTVRSLTGNLFESFGQEQLIFLALILAIEDAIPLRPTPRSTTRVQRDAPRRSFDPSSA